MCKRKVLVLTADPASQTTRRVRLREDVRGAKVFLAAFVMNLTALEVAAQLFCRWYLPPESAPDRFVHDDKQLGWVYRDGCRDQSPYFNRGFELCFNGQGLRGTVEYTPPLKALFLGDSVVEAQHVPQEETFVDRLGGANAGCDSYTIYQIRDRYRRDLSKLEPRAVILVVSGASVRSEEENRQAIRTLKLLNRDLARKYFFSKSGLYRFLRWRLEQRGTVSMASRKESEEDKDKGYLKRVEKEYDSSVWREWTQALLDLRDSVSGGRFIVVWSPPRAQVKAFRDGRRGFWVPDRLEEFCRENRIQFLDLLPALSHHDVTDVFTDYVHYNTNGHRIVADEMAKLLSGLPSVSR